MSNPPKTRKHALNIPEATRKEIIELHENGYGTRRIAARVQPSRKAIRQILREEGHLKPHSSQPKKLAGFEALIEEKVKARLTISRIFRELQELGYSGQRTILADFVRGLRSQHALETNTKKVTRRFETPPGQEMQIDWSPCWVQIGDQKVLVKAFGCLLCASRKLFVYFFDNERQTTLFEALAMAFEYFDGCALVVVLDNMSTAIVTRYGAEGKPIFQPAFLDFAAHYGFTPYPCHVNDPDRKGKKEKSFRLVKTDLLRGSTFDSLDDLNQRAKVWLDHTPGAGNLRVHGTTQRVPNEAYKSEHALLIRLPEARFAVYEASIRVVDADSTLSVRGQRYSVPTQLANQNVQVRLYAEYFEVLDRKGHISTSRRYVDSSDRGPPVIDPTHYENLPKRAKQGTFRLHEAFEQRYPELRPFVQGLFEKMNTLTPIHLRALIRLSDQYGQEKFLKAAKRAQDYRNFSAQAVERILEKEYGVPDELPHAPLGGLGPLRIGEVDAGSLDDYSHLDRTPAPSAHPKKDQSKE